MEHTKPRVTIDLDEYNELLAVKKEKSGESLKNAMSDSDYEEAYSAVIGALIRNNGHTPLDIVLEGMSRGGEYSYAVVASVIKVRKK